MGSEHLFLSLLPKKLLPARTLVTPFRVLPAPSWGIRPAAGRVWKLVFPGEVAQSRPGIGMSMAVIGLPEKKRFTRAHCLSRVLYNLSSLCV